MGPFSLTGWLRSGKRTRIAQDSLGPCLSMATMEVRLVVFVLGLAVLVAMAVAFWFLFGAGKSKPRATGNDLLDLRRAETKVKLSDPITRLDIDILERYGSDHLDDAIALRRAQLLRGDHPDSQSPS